MGCRRLSEDGVVDLRAGGGASAGRNGIGDGFRHGQEVGLHIRRVRRKRCPKRPEAGDDFIEMSGMSCLVQSSRRRLR